MKLASLGTGAALRTRKPLEADGWGTRVRTSQKAQLTTEEHSMWSSGPPESPEWSSHQNIQRTRSGPHPPAQLSWAHISFRPAAEPVSVTNTCTSAQEGTVGVPRCQHYHCVCAWCVHVKVGGQLSRFSLSYRGLNSGSLPCAANPSPSEPSSDSERGRASHLLSGLCRQRWLRSGDSLGMTNTGISIPLSSQSPTLESS